MLKGQFNRSKFINDQMCLKILQLEVNYSTTERIIFDEIVLNLVQVN